MIDMNRIIKRFLAAVLIPALLWMIPLPTRAAQGGKLIALTFDDGPGKPTGGLLDGLKERGIPVTFFMLGNCAESWPATVERAYREGHQIANHSWSHANMIYLSGEDAAWEFHRTNEELKKNSGGASGFLARVPYGNYNDTVRAAVGMPIIGWTVDPLDWKYRNAETVRKNIVSSAFDGAIVLVHDIHPTSVEGALLAVDDLTAAGYEFVTVRELFRRRGIDLQNGSVYRSAPPNGTDKGPVAPPVLETSVTDGVLTVTMSAGEGAEIRCTLDGSDPVFFGWKYTGPFAAWPGLNVRAVAAYCMNGSRSGEIAVTLTCPEARPPKMMVEDGRLILTSPDPGAAVFYTTDGGRPGHDSVRYDAPVTLDPGSVVRAVSGGDHWLDSGESRGWYSPLGVFFRDVMPEDWFARAVDTVAGAGWLRGVGDDLFSPSTPLYRGQLVTILHRMAGEPDAEALTFPDASEGDYFLPGARWAVSAGITERDEDGGFSPGETVSREELAVMLHRYLTATGTEAGGDSPLPFADRDEISPDALSAVDAVSARGILIGDTEGCFRPKAFLTRAEAAVIFARLLPNDAE